MIEIAPEALQDPPGPEFLRRLRQFHDRMWDNWRFLKAQLFLEGNIIESIPTAAGVRIIVPHKLGRVPQGYFITRVISNAPLSITEAVGEVPTEDFIIFIPSAAGFINIYIF